MGPKLNMFYFVKVTFQSDLRYNRYCSHQRVFGKSRHFDNDF